MALQLGIDRRCVWQHLGKPGTIQTGVSPGKEQGGTETEIGDAVSMGFGDPLDHPVQTKAPEVVGHFALRDVIGLLPGEDCELCPQIPIGETTRQQTKPDQQITAPVRGGR